MTREGVGFHLKQARTQARRPRARNHPLASRLPHLLQLRVLEQGSLVTLEVICPEEHLEAVEEEVYRQLRTMTQELVTDQELLRGQQLVSNGLRYALEATGQVSGLCASQTLWDRPQDLLQPLNFLPPWTAERLRADVFPRLQPEHACVLTAQAKTEHG